MNGTQAGGYLASFLTTLVTTGLIAYKIYSVSNEDKAARGNFKHILDILVQSGVIYALALLVTACESLKLLTLVSTNGVTSTQLFGLQSYSSALLGPIAVCIRDSGMSVYTIVLLRLAAGHCSDWYGCTSCSCTGCQRASINEPSSIRSSIPRKFNQTK